MFNSKLPTYAAFGAVALYFGHKLAQYQDTRLKQSLALETEKMADYNPQDILNEWDKLKAKEHQS